MMESWVVGQAEIMHATWRSMGVPLDQAFQPESPLRSRFGWTSAQDVARSPFYWFQQMQTYFGVLTCVVGGLVLHRAIPERTLAETLVFEFYVTAQATLFLGVLGPLCFWIAPSFIGGLPLVLRTGLHAHGGGVFFEGRWRAHLFPILAYVASLLTLFLVSMLVGLGVAFSVN